MASSEILLEFIRHGQYLKCTAVDPVTGLEASAMGPVNDRPGVQRLAILKLQNALQAHKGRKT